jgi:hypothetical protein
MDSAALLVLALLDCAFGNETAWTQEGKPCSAGESMSGWRIKVTKPDLEEGGSKIETWIVGSLDQGQAVELLINTKHASKDNPIEIVGRVSTEEMQRLGIASGEAVIAK